MALLLRRRPRRRFVCGLLSAAPGQDQAQRDAQGPGRVPGEDAVQQGGAQGAHRSLRQGVQRAGRAGSTGVEAVRGARLGLGVLTCVQRARAPGGGAQTLRGRRPHADSLIKAGLKKHLGSGSCSMRDPVKRLWLTARRRQTPLQTTCLTWSTPTAMVRLFVCAAIATHSLQAPSTRASCFQGCLSRAEARRSRLGRSTDACLPAHFSFGRQRMDLMFKLCAALRARCCMPCSRTAGGTPTATASWTRHVHL